VKASVQFLRRVKEYASKGELDKRDHPEKLEGLKKKKKKSQEVYLPSQKKNKRSKGKKEEITKNTNKCGESGVKGRGKRTHFKTVKEHCNTTRKGKWE